MNKTQSLQTDLTRWASIVLGIMSPGAGRMFHPVVQFTDEKNTACTQVQSAWIKLPEVFFGANLRQSPDISLGLLAHELGHWLQPDREIDAAWEQSGLDPRVVNLILDIQDEAMIASIFPPFTGPLTAVRELVNVDREAVWREALMQTTDFLEAFFNWVFLCRFGGGEAPFSLTPASVPRLDRASLEQIKATLDCLNELLYLSAQELPGFIREFAAKFPELCLDRDAEQPDDGESGMPGGSGTGEPTSAADTAGSPAGQDAQSDRGGEPGPSASSSDGAGAAGCGAGTDPGAFQDEISAAVQRGGSRLEDLKHALQAAGVAEFRPSPTCWEPDVPCQMVGSLRQGSDAAISRTASRLAVHFKTPKGAMTIQAPDRLNLYAAIRQDPCPFRMDIPGRFSSRPLPKVVLALDHSGSMVDGNKWRTVLSSAAAIAQAVATAGGDVRVLAFDSQTWHLPDYDPGLLRAQRLRKTAAPSGRDSELNMNVPDGGTSFAWLPDVWVQFPDHLIILLTDGEGYPPPFVPQMGRQRTSAIVIPPGQPQSAAVVAGRVVVVEDLNALPGAFLTLIPRQWVA